MILYTAGTPVDQLPTAEGVIRHKRVPYEWDIQQLKQDIVSSYPKAVSTLALIGFDLYRSDQGRHLIKIDCQPSTKVEVVKKVIRNGRLYLIPNGVIFQVCICCGLENCMFYT